MAVDSKKIARAIRVAKPKEAMPAPEIPEAKVGTEAIHLTPPIDAQKIRRAIDATKPTRTPPAETSEARLHTTSTGASPPTKPGRATRPSKPSPVSPAPDAEARPATEPTHQAPPPDPVLFTIRQLGRLLDDIELMRIMNGNRIKAGQRAGVDQPWMAMVGEHLDRLEHAVELELKRAWRKHPLAEWAKAIPGAGEVLMGRLIAEIGDPAERPNPGKLLAYCGHGDPTRAGQVPKGATQEELFKRGNPRAKKAVWKLSYQFMRTVGANVRSESNHDPHRPIGEVSIAFSKSNLRSMPRSPYRDVYDERKAATEGKLHAKACKRCGPAGHPAPAGSPWSDAHRHADALRVVGKRFLIDLWVASRHHGDDAKRANAGGES